MKLHVSTEVSTLDILQAARYAERKAGHGSVYVTDVRPAGSRSAPQAFNVTLTGDGSVKKHRPMHWSGDLAQYMASYESWGWFLAYLYEIDSAMKCAYRDASDFHARTRCAFDPDGNYS